MITLGVFSETTSPWPKTEAPVQALCPHKEEEEKEEFLDIGNWRGKHNSMSLEGIYSASYTRAARFLLSMMKPI